MLTRSSITTVPRIPTKQTPNDQHVTTIGLGLAESLQREKFDQMLSAQPPLDQVLVCGSERDRVDNGNCLHWHVSCEQHPRVFSHINGHQ